MGVKMPFRFDGRPIRALKEPKILLKEFLVKLEVMFENLIVSEVAGIDFRSDLFTQERLFEQSFLDMRKREVFSTAISNIRNVELERLEECGLTDTALSSKLGLLEIYSDQLRKGIKKALKYLLELINSILSSIKFALGAASGAVIDFIAEFKDMVKSKIGLANDW